MIGQIRHHRRAVLAMLVASCFGWPSAARAQSTRKVARIAFLGPATEEAWGPWVAAFDRRLGQLGWADGSTASIDHRWAEGRSERFAEIAAEFVRDKADVIVTGGNAVHDVMRATETIPIVFAIAIDPLSSGFVANLARPGGNVTGLSLESADAAGKRLQILREIIPNLRRLAVLANVDYSGALRELEQVAGAAAALRLQAERLEVRKPEELANVFATLGREVQAVYVCDDAFAAANYPRVNALAAEAGVPTLHAKMTYLGAGGLVSYGPNYTDLFVRAAEITNKILRGTRPADIPVEQPVKFELGLNLKTAKALGLTVPSSLLARADEVIE